MKKNNWEGEFDDFICASLHYYNIVATARNENISEFDWLFIFNLKKFKMFVKLLAFNFGLYEV